MNPDTWDLAIVGAGPAGSAAAISALRASPGARVLLVDAAEFPRDKVCGDGIASHALEVLAGLGVDPAELVADTAPVTRLRLHAPSGAVAARTLAQPGAVVPRRLFDARLRDAALGAGAVFRRHRVRDIAQGGDGLILDGALHARVVVAADGAESVLRRRVGLPAPRTGTVAVALRGYVASDRMPPGEQLLCMTGAHWPAYAWAFPVGDGTANVGYGELLQNGSGPSRAAMVQRLRRLLRMVLPDGEIGSLRGHRLPLSPGRPPVARGRVLFAGDAASLINPITGEGIYYAVLSGALAGAAAFAARPDDAYRRALARQLAGHFRHTDILAELGRFPVLINAAVAAAGRSQRVFDDIVELGLGHGGMTARVAAALAREALRA